MASVDDDKAERSRRYPAASLREAIGMVEAVHRGVGLNGGARETLAQALGHTTLNGTSKRKLATLVQFGLLEKDGERYRISTGIGRRILMPVNDRERNEAIAEAARRPLLFQEIGMAYDGHMLPSMLANVLAREHGVLPQTSAEVAQIFTESVEFAGLLGEDGVLRWTLPPTNPFTANAPRNADRVAPDPELYLGTDPGQRQPSTVAVGSSGSSGGERSTEDYTIALDGKGRKAVIHLPTPVRDRDLTKLSAWVAYMRSVVNEQEEETPDASAT